jgi:hypothetical protein
MSILFVTIIYFLALDGDLALAICHLGSGNPEQGRLSTGKQPHGVQEYY